MVKPEAFYNSWPLTTLRCASRLNPPREFGIKSGQSVVELFDRIGAAIDEDAAEIAIRYHPTLGYPETGYIDYSEMIADEEWSFAILEPPLEPAEAVAVNRAKWSSRKPSTYQFQLHYQSAWWSVEALIGVAGGVPEFIGEGTPSNDYVVRSVEQLFDDIEEGISRSDEGNVYSVAFDPELGYPILISDNWWQIVVDGGQRFRLSGLQAWSPEE